MNSFIKLPWPISQSNDLKSIVALMKTPYINLNFKNCTQICTQIIKITIKAIQAKLLHVLSGEGGITCGDPLYWGHSILQMTVRCAHFHSCFSALLKQAWQGSKQKCPARGVICIIAEKEGFVTKGYARSPELTTRLRLSPGTARPG
jgi:hypothetical protein